MNLYDYKKAQFRPIRGVYRGEITSGSSVRELNGHATIQNLSGNLKIDFDGTDIDVTGAIDVSMKEVTLKGESTYQVILWG